MTQIIDAYLGLAALRQAGYRSTATAVAELVDNSIEAGADDIEIIALTHQTIVNTRSSNQVKQIAVLDNGLGMTQEVLGKCLSLGWGTRLETRAGLGRFGFGLKGASISQARVVEVYSWISKDDVYMTYMDLEEIKSNKLQDLKEITPAKLPQPILENFADKLGESGTLVVWDELDQIDLRKAETLLRRINKDLCRIYRHFLDNDDAYGEKRKVSLHMLNLDTGKLEESLPLFANDPLYRLIPNNLPGYESECTNEIFEEFNVPIKYHNGINEVISEVLITASIAKPEIQDLGGNSTQGKHYADNTGISFVRAGREIDFGTFGFLDRSEPRHRWWGIEIRFEPELDELFGVTNNKQEVRAIQKLDEDTIEALLDTDSRDNHGAKLKIELNKVIADKIDSMMKIIKSRRAGAQTQKRQAKGIVEKVNEDISKDTNPTESEEISKTKSEDEKIKERINLLLSDDSNLSSEEAESLARETLDYRVDILTDDWPGELFLDRRSVANSSVGKINRSTLFYEQFWHYLENQDDKKGFEALEILFMAYVRTEDELVREYDRKTFERFRQRWGSWVEKLITHAGN